MLHLTSHCCKCLPPRLSTNLHKLNLNYLASSRLTSSFSSSHNKNPHQFNYGTIIHCNPTSPNENNLSFRKRYVGHYVNHTMMTSQLRHYVVPPSRKKELPTGSPINWTSVITCIALGTLGESRCYTLLK